MGDSAILNSNYSLADIPYEDTTFFKSHFLFKNISVLVLSLIATTISTFIYFFYILILKSDQLKEKNLELFLFKLPFIFLLSVSIWLLIYICWLLIKRRYIDSEHAFTEIILTRLQKYILALCFLIAFVKVLNLFEKILKLKLIKQRHTIVEDPIMSNLYTYILVLIVFLSFITIGRLLVEGTNFLMLKSNLFRKLPQVNKDMQILHLISSRVSNKPINRSDKYIEMIYSKLIQNEHVLTYKTLVEIFNKEESQKIYDKFDIHRNKKIPLKQFTSVWTHILKNKDQIDILFEHKDNLIRKISIVFLLILGPVALFVILLIFDRAASFKTYSTVFLGYILSLNFAIGPVLGELFKSITFIFLVLPFEVGDTIEFDKKIYKVEEVGILYTTLINKSLPVVVPNTQLMNKALTNYRLSDKTEKVYTFKFKIQTYKKILELLTSKVKKLVKKFSYTFSRDVNIKNVILISNKRLQIDILVYVYTHGIDNEKEVDEFVIELNDLIYELKHPDLNKTAQVQEI